MKTALTTVALALSLASTAHAGAVTKLLQYLPEDSQIIATIDLDRVKAHRLGEFAFKLLDQQMGPQKQELIQQLGTDPLASLKSLGFFSNIDSVTKAPYFCIAAEMPVNMDVILKSLQASGATVTKRQENKIDIHQIEGGEFAYAAPFFIACNQSQVSSSLNASKVKHTSDAHRTAVLKAAPQKMAALSILMDDKIKAMMPLDQFPVEAKEFLALSGTLGMTGKDLRLDLKTSFSSPLSAKKTVEDLNKTLDQLFQNPTLAAFGLKRSDAVTKQVQKDAELTFTLNETISTAMIGLLQLALTVSENKDAFDQMQGKDSKNKK